MAPSKHDEDCGCNEAGDENPRTIIIDGVAYCPCQRQVGSSTEGPTSPDLRRVCASCGATSVASNHFCGQCGAELPEEAESTEVSPANTGKGPATTGAVRRQEDLDSGGVADAVGMHGAASELSPPVDIPEASRIQRGVYRFEVLYGWFDPVLWLAIAFTLPGVLVQGAGVYGAMAYLAIFLPLSILFFSGLRYPLAIFTRSSRLSRNRPTGSTGEPQWLPDPARLGTWRLWDGTGWTATVSGHPPPPKKGIALGTVSVGLALTALIVLSLVTGGALNFGPSSVAASSDPALRQVQQDMTIADEQYAEAQRQADALAARPDPKAVESLRTSVSQVAAILIALKVDIRALPSSVSASDREKLQEYAVTGLAAVNYQAQMLTSILGCQQRPTRAQRETCVAVLEATYGNRARVLEQKWVDAARDVGY